MATSSLLVDEYFSAQDVRFLDAVRELRAPRELAALAERWKKDGRPWARAQLFAYLDLPFDRPGHQVVVKRVVKHAEESGDDELMAHCMLAFDRMVRRKKKARLHYDRSTRAWIDEERLIAPSNAMRGQSPKEKKRPGRVSPQTGREMVNWVPRGARLFTYHTRYHLRRRAWRFFRRMGHQQPDAFAGAVARALALYRDADLARGENILDSWSLVNALFRHHPAIEVTPSEIKLREGHGLAELSPAPKFRELWQQASAVPVLIGLVATGGARLVRVWAMRMLRDHHRDRLANQDPAGLLRLLDHDDPEVQRFGAELTAVARDLDKLKLEAWLRLLATRNLDALEILTGALRKHVRLDRFSLDEAIGLASATAAPVARVGLEALEARTLAAGERAQLARLAAAACEALSGGIARWALAQLAVPQGYDREVATAFLDSAHRGARAVAWTWLTTGTVPEAFADSELWSRLVESPHDDIRLALVDLLAARAARPALRGDLTPIWTSCLLAVHRGGRQKGKAAQQLRAALEADPARAEVLLPVLAVAIRSVRHTEQRAGLAAVVALVEARPELAAVVRRVLPELDLNPGGAA